MKKGGKLYQMGGVNNDPTKKAERRKALMNQLRIANDPKTNYGSEQARAKVWDQMIWEFGDDEEPNWVHISYKSVGQNRKQIKRARRDEKNKVYYTVENA